VFNALSAGNPLGRSPSVRFVSYEQQLQRQQQQRLQKGAVLDLAVGNRPDGQQVRKWEEVGRCMGEGACEQQVSGCTWWG